MFIQNIPDLTHSELSAFPEFTYLNSKTTQGLEQRCYWCRSTLNPRSTRQGVYLEAAVTSPTSCCTIHTARATGHRPQSQPMTSSPGYSQPDVYLGSQHCCIWTSGQTVSVGPGRLPLLSTQVLPCCPWSGSLPRFHNQAAPTL